MVLLNRKMKILFLSSHIGLGHVTRDLQVKELLVRKSRKIDVVWCSAHPVYEYPIGKGEKVIDACRELSSMSPIAEQYIENKVIFRPSILKSYLKILERNYRILDEDIVWDDYDLVYADEFWELVLAENFKHTDRLFFATDFVFKQYEINPIENLISYILNQYFIRRFKAFRYKAYIGLLDEIPNQRISLIHGEYMPSWVGRNFIVVGKIPSVDQTYRESSPEVFKKRLGIDPEYKVITVLLGGTRSRSEILLQRICSAWESIRDEFGGKLVIILGPRTKYDCDEENVEIHNLVYEVGEYLASSDIIISRAGRTTVTDIEYLGIPSIIIPIKGHFEQKWIAKISSSKYEFVESLNEEFTAETLVKKVRKLMNMGRFKTKVNEFKGAEKIVSYILNIIS